MDKVGAEEALAEGQAEPKETQEVKPEDLLGGVEAAPCASELGETENKKKPKKRDVIPRELLGLCIDMDWCRDRRTKDEKSNGLDVNHRKRSDYYQHAESSKQASTSSEQSRSQESSANSSSDSKSKSASTPSSSEKPKPEKSSQPKPSKSKEKGKTTNMTKNDSKASVNGKVVVEKARDKGGKKRTRDESSQTSEKGKSTDASDREGQMPSSKKHAKEERAEKGVGVPDVTVDRDSASVDHSLAEDYPFDSDTILKLRSTIVFYNLSEEDELPDGKAAKGKYRMGLYKGLFVVNNVTDDGTVTFVPVNELNKNAVSKYVTLDKDQSQSRDAKVRHELDSTTTPSCLVLEDLALARTDEGLGLCLVLKNINIHSYSFEPKRNRNHAVAQMEPVGVPRMSCSREHQESQFGSLEFTHSKPQENEPRDYYYLLFRMSGGRVTPVLGKVTERGMIKRYNAALLGSNAVLTGVLRHIILSSVTFSTPRDSHKDVVKDKDAPKELLFRFCHATRDKTLTFEDCACLGCKLAIQLLTANSQYYPVQHAAAAEMASARGVSFRVVNVLTQSALTLTPAQKQKPKQEEKTTPKSTLKKAVPSEETPKSSADDEVYESLTQDSVHRITRRMNKELHSVDSSPDTRVREEPKADPKPVKRDVASMTTAQVPPKEPEKKAEPEEPPKRRKLTSPPPEPQTHTQPPAQAQVKSEKAYFPPPRLIQLTDSNHGFNYVGFLMKHAPLDKEPFNKKGRDWTYAVIKYWDPKYKAFFIHTLRDEITHGASDPQIYRRLRATTRGAFADKVAWISTHASFLVALGEDPVFDRLNRHEEHATDPSHGYDASPSCNICNKRILVLRRDFTELPEACEGDRYDDELSLDDFITESLSIYDYPNYLFRNPVHSTVLALRELEQVGMSRIVSLLESNMDITKLFFEDYDRASINLYAKPTLYFCIKLICWLRRCCGVGEALRGSSRMRLVYWGFKCATCSRYFHAKCLNYQHLRKAAPLMTKEHVLNRLVKHRSMCKNYRLVTHMRSSYYSNENLYTTTDYKLDLDSDEDLTGSDTDDVSPSALAGPSKHRSLPVRAIFKSEPASESSQGSRDSGHYVYYPMLDCSDEATEWSCPDCRTCVYCCLPIRERAYIRRFNYSYGFTESSMRPYKQFPPCFEEKVDHLQRNCLQTDKVKDVVCVSCNVAAHRSCCNPVVPNLLFIESWKCDSCTQCISCGYRDTTCIEYLNWGLFFFFCLKCWELMERTNYCGVCYKVWTNFDTTSQKWVQCEGCKLWIHVECDELARIITECPSSRNQNYRCSICRSSNKMVRCMKLLEQIFTVDKLNQFRYPVSPTFVTYWRLVTRPMNLVTLFTKVEALKYKTISEFIFDIFLIPYNAKMVNMPNTKIYKFAIIFDRKCRQIVTSIMQITNEEIDAIMDNGINGGNFAAKEKRLAPAEEGEESEVAGMPSTDQGVYPRKRSLNSEDAAVDGGHKPEQPKRSKELAESRSQVIKYNLSFEFLVAKILNIDLPASQEKLAHPKETAAPRERPPKVPIYGKQLEEMLTYNYKAVCEFYPAFVPCGLNYAVASVVSLVGTKFMFPPTFHEHEDFKELVRTKRLIMLNKNRDKNAYLERLSNPENRGPQHDYQELYTDSQAQIDTAAKLLFSQGFVQLRDHCAVCGSNSYQSYFVHCEDCAEPMHYYCAGLLFPPMLVNYRHFRCAGCSKCNRCRGRVNSNHPYEIANINNFHFGDALGYIPTLITNIVLYSSQIISETNQAAARREEQGYGDPEAEQNANLLKYATFLDGRFRVDQKGLITSTTVPKNLANMSKFPVNSVKCVSCGDTAHLSCIKLVNSGTHYMLESTYRRTVESPSDTAATSQHSHFEPRFVNGVYRDVLVVEPPPPPLKGDVHKHLKKLLRTRNDLLKLVADQAELVDLDPSRECTSINLAYGTICSYFDPNKPAENDSYQRSKTALKHVLMLTKRLSMCEELITSIKKHLSSRLIDKRKSVPCRRPCRPASRPRLAQIEEYLPRAVEACAQPQYEGDHLRLKVMFSSSIILQDGNCGDLVAIEGRSDRSSTDAAHSASSREDAGYENQDAQSATESCSSSDNCERAQRVACEYHDTQKPYRAPTFFDFSSVFKNLHLRPPSDPQQPLGVTHTAPQAFQVNPFMTWEFDGSGLFSCSSDCLHRYYKLKDESLVHDAIFSNALATQFDALQSTYNIADIGAQFDREGYHSRCIHQGAASMASDDEADSCEEHSSSTSADSRATRKASNRIYMCRRCVLCGRSVKKTVEGSSNFRIRSSSHRDELILPDSVRGWVMCNYCKFYQRYLDRICRTISSSGEGAEHEDRTPKGSESMLDTLFSRPFGTALSISSKSVLMSENIANYFITLISALMPRMSNSALKRVAYDFMAEAETAEMYQYVYNAMASSPLAPMSFTRWKELLLTYHKDKEFMDHFPAAAEKAEAAGAAESEPARQQEDNAHELKRAYINASHYLMIKRFTNKVATSTRLYWTYRDLLSYKIFFKNIGLTRAMNVAPPYRYGRKSLTLLSRRLQRLFHHIVNGNIYSDGWTERFRHMFPYFRSHVAHLILNGDAKYYMEERRRHKTPWLMQYSRVDRGSSSPSYILGKISYEAEVILSVLYEFMRFANPLSPKKSKDIVDPPEFGGVQDLYKKLREHKPPVNRTSSRTLKNFISKNVSIFDSKVVTKPKTNIDFERIYEHIKAVRAKLAAQSKMEDLESYVASTLGSSLLVDVVSARAIAGDVSIRDRLTKSGIASEFCDSHDALVKPVVLSRTSSVDSSGPSETTEYRPFNACCLCGVSRNTVLRGSLLPWRNGFVHSECILWSISDVYLPRTYNYNYDNFYTLFEPASHEYVPEVYSSAKPDVGDLSVVRPSEPLEPVDDPAASTAEEGQEARDDPAVSADSALPREPEPVPEHAEFGEVEPEVDNEQPVEFGGPVTKDEVGENFGQSFPTERNEGHRAYLKPKLQEPEHQDANVSLMYMPLLPPVQVPDTAVERVYKSSLTTACWWCSKPGASVTCANYNCNVSFHLSCAFVSSSRLVHMLFKRDNPDHEYQERVFPVKMYFTRRKIWCASCFDLIAQNMKSYHLKTLARAKRNDLKCFFALEGISSAAVRIVFRQSLQSVRVIPPMVDYKKLDIFLSLNSKEYGHAKNAFTQTMQKHTLSEQVTKFIDDILKPDASQEQVNRINSEYDFKSKYFLYGADKHKDSLFSFSVPGLGYPEAITHTVYRAGALTIISLGEALMHDNFGSLYPVGFTSIRRYWNSNYFRNASVAQREGEKRAHAECEAENGFAEAERGGAEGAKGPGNRARRTVRPASHEFEEAPAADFDHAGHFGQAERSFYMCSVRALDGLPYFTIDLISHPDSRLPSRRLAQGADIIEVFKCFKRLLGADHIRMRAESFFGLNLHIVLQQLRFELASTMMRRATQFCRIASFKQSVLGSRVTNFDFALKLGEPTVNFPFKINKELMLEHITTSLDFREHEQADTEYVDLRINRSRSRKQFDLGTASTQYRYLSSMPPEKRLDVKPSVIHGLGLFASEYIPAGEPVVEYVGELIRDVISDQREEVYSEGQGGDGSCYMFRLDDQLIVDATRKGNMSRFINHSCDPNCMCRIITCENGLKHIVVFAKSDLEPGDEVTYDYQFGVESETRKLMCLCGAANCLGRMN